jgi:hypothetical protein
MRKLILVTAIAMMSTTSCYANLSLASSEPAPARTVEQAKVDQSASNEPLTSAKSLPTKRHKRHLPAHVAHPVYQVRSYSYGHCL